MSLRFLLISSHRISSHSLFTALSSIVIKTTVLISSSLANTIVVAITPSIRTYTGRSSRCVPQTFHHPFLYPFRTPTPTTRPSLFRLAQAVLISLSIPPNRIEDFTSTCIHPFRRVFFSLSPVKRSSSVLRSPQQRCSDRENLVTETYRLTLGLANVGAH